MQRDKVLRGKELLNMCLSIKIERGDHAIAKNYRHDWMMPTKKTHLNKIITINILPQFVFPFHCGNMINIHKKEEYCIRLE